MRERRAVTVAALDVRWSDLVCFDGDRFAGVKSIARVVNAGGVLIELATAPIHVSVFRKFDEPIEVMRYFSP